ncbi:MAG TPA: PIN domain-containing protein [Thermoanaerobaculia bacterium]|nr:PIN domain-containing protein [Thermoanaerobaculia bacterium]
MNLFLDSNVWLSLFDSFRRDLDELRRLADLVEGGSVTLLLPDQVVNEVRRNRDKRIASDIEQLRSEILLEEIPPLFYGLQEYQSFARVRRNYLEAKDRLVARLIENFEQGRLPADESMDRLFAAARRLPVSDALLARARTRYDLGNPPGKEGSYGDAVIWECLLAEVKDGEDLYLVTRDRDFASKVDRGRLSPFLDREWTERKRSRVVFYNRLSAFCRDNLPEVRLTDDLEEEADETSSFESR